ncbi:MAG TPA: hypothetical protein VI522_02410, partial [Gammaproteobacteria bacterium]|nr:hypothetical protein [Gammaproteobacteria bacterium]
MLQQLAACYQKQPIPQPGLLKKLIDNKITIENFIAEHNSNPFGERSVVKLNQQFDDVALRPYVDRAKQLTPKETKPLTFGNALHAQLKFVNVLGKQQFRHWSVSEIQKRLHEIRAQLKDSKTDEQQHVLQLTALSLIREAVYKTARAAAVLWPTAVQMLTILSAINHPSKCPLFLQLATGEGKSLVAVFRSLLLWVNGSGVAVVTHRASLAYRDALVFAPLFEGLKIECKHLTAERYQKDQQSEFKGIYYVEFNDLALIRQQRLLSTGLDIAGLSFIIDEGDELILHNQTDNNLSQTVGETEAHPYAWVFENLAAYLDTYAQGYNELTVCLSDLVGYLRVANPIAQSACQSMAF